MRVAFFTDSFHEINGVAHTSRNLDAFARRRDLPFLSVHAGDSTTLVQSGNHIELNLKRSWLGIPLDNNMSFDVLFFRHWKTVIRALQDFRPDVIHITGPSDVGLIGAIAALHLRIPILASWHTNLHEYAGTRLGSLISWCTSGSARRKLERFAENVSLDILCYFYSLARLLLAPNLELQQMLESKTGLECRLMHRGVDRETFHPGRRCRNDDAVVLGFCGRLRPEKNVRLLARIEEMLLAEGVTHYRFLVVGDGSEREWLQQNLHSAELPGVLRGTDLAQAYANMDLFLFPSWTDTFGNVILESLACGSPCIVTSGGGPKYLIEEGVSGLVAPSDSDFVEAAVQVARDSELLGRLRQGALESRFVKTWDDVFEELYEAYRDCAASSVANKTLPSDAL